MQKNFVVEVYNANGEKTYIVRQPDDQLKSYVPVLVTTEVEKVSDFLKSV